MAGCEGREGGVHCKKLATEDFRRDQREGQYDRPGCRSDGVYSLLPLCRLMLRAGEQGCQDIQRLLRDTRKPQGL